MKKLLTFFSVIALVVIAQAFSSGPPDGKTGAPGEGNCTDCHSSFPINSGDGMFTIDAPEEFQPGETYTITVTLSDNGQQRWGFELTPLSIGTVTITDAINTLSSTSGGNTYVKQTSAGTYNGNPDGPVTWQFDWTAPTVDPPASVTMYANGNAANANFSTSGDYIYSTSVTIEQFTSIDDFRDGTLPDILAMKSYPNPFNASTTINYAVPSDGIVNLSIYDIQGRLVDVLEEGYRNVGLYDVSWSGKDRYDRDVVSGIYFVKLAVNDNSAVEKLVLLK